MSQAMRTINIDSTLFYPIEHALLHAWLNIPRPEALRGIDIYEAPKDGMGIWADGSEVCGETVALDNAVARLVMGGIQGRLPQCGIVYGPDEVVLCRQPIAKHPRGVSFLPQFLFMINWADSAPGLSWPESYHATYLPVYAVYVVTAAQDSPDMWGVTEQAIGAFPKDQPLLEGAREAITEFWNHQRREWDQHQWEYVWDEGLVTKELAGQWADQVWGEQEDEEGDDEIPLQIRLAKPLACS